MTFWRMSKSGNFCNKIVSILLIQTFILSSLALAAPGPSPVKSSSTNATIVNPDKIVIPREFGLVKSKFTGTSDRLVVHIQDAHCNYEAQSNIAKILENLIKNYNVTFVSVEGADGAIDTSWFKAFPDEEVRKEVADYFMKKGEITGPEFLSITTDYPLKLFGAETRSYYIENLNAFTSSYPLKADTERYYNNIKSALNRLKGYIYNDELKDLDAKAADYESKKIQFNDYVRFLQELAEKHKINLRAYENFFRLVSVLVYEKKIDFNVTDKERNALIDDLSKRISKEILTELVSQSLSFKSGKISSAEYYSYLKNLAIKNGIDLSKDYPNLYNYTIYNSAYSKIENEKLFGDIRSLEIAIKEKLFQNDDQRMLEKLSRHIEILLGLVNIKLMNGDFDYYQAHKAEFTPDVFSDFIKNKTIQYGLAYEIDPPTDAVAANVPKMEDFYSIAIKRDKALIDNTLNAMDEAKQKVAVLITGGFHSEGISKLLEKEKISYMVVCPTITKDVATPYIKILMNQRTPLEDILVGTAEAKESKDGTLAPPSRTHCVALGYAELHKLGFPQLEIEISAFEDEWIHIFINGVHIGSIKIEGYLKHALKNTGGVSSSIIEILENLKRQIRENKKLKDDLREELLAKVKAVIASEDIQKRVSAEMERQLEKKQSQARAKGALPQIGDKITVGQNSIRANNSAHKAREKYEKLTEWMHEEYNKLLEKSFKEGTYEIRKVLVDNRWVDNCLHYGMEDRVYQRNKELESEYNGSAVQLEDRVYLQTDIEAHPSRGGIKFDHKLLQVQLSGLKYFFFTKGEIVIINRHELAHIDIANGVQELINRKMIRADSIIDDILKLKDSLQDVEKIVKPTCFAYIKALIDNPNLDEEDFVDSLPGCDTRTSGIRDKFKKLEEFRSRSSDTLDRLAHGQNHITITDLEAVTTIDRQLEIGSKRVKEIFQKILTESRYSNIREYIKDYLSNRAMLDYITNMREVSSSDNRGFDVYIFVSTSATEAAYWQERFEATRGQILPKNSIILSIYSEGEDRWHGKTDNGSASLYAFMLADELLKAKYMDLVKSKYGQKMSLMDILKAERPVMMMLMAGSGKRMQPMAANNKSSIALPDTVIINDSEVPLTIGESVARTFGPMADSRGGRLTEVWGDQINLPSENINSDNLYAAEIFSTMCPFETAADKRYAASKGVLIFAGENRDVMQREKPPLEDIEANARKVGGQIVADLSLGFNSYRWELLTEFLEMYEKELGEKRGHFNIDSELWSPFTFDSSLSYSEFMWEKRYVELKKAYDTGKIDAFEFASRTSDDEKSTYITEKGEWWVKVHIMLEHFNKKYGSKYRITNGRHGVIGRVDYGFKDRTTDWWDFGQIKNYYDSLMLALFESSSIDKRREAWASERVRRYFGIRNKSDWLSNSYLGECKVENSIALGCKIAKGSIKNCILINVTAEEINAENAIIIGSVIYKLDATEGFNIVQDVVSERQISLKGGDVMASHHIPGQGQKTFRVNYLLDNRKDTATLETVEDRRGEGAVFYEADEIYGIPVWNNPMPFANLSLMAKRYTKKEQEIEKEKIVKGVRGSINNVIAGQIIASIVKAVKTGDRNTLRAYGEYDHANRLADMFTPGMVKKLIEHFNTIKQDSRSGKEILYFCSLLLNHKDPKIREMAAREIEVINKHLERYEYCSMHFKLPKFGTSGLRDKNKNLTDIAVYIVTKGCIDYLENLGDRITDVPLETRELITKGMIGKTSSIVLAGDLRPSTRRILIAAAAAIFSRGHGAEYIGRKPTQVAANYGFRKNKAVIVVTGSHIPIDENGLKPYRPNGEFLKDEENIMLGFVERAKEEEFYKIAEESMFNDNGMFKAERLLQPDAAALLERATWAVYDDNNDVRERAAEAERLYEGERFARGFGKCLENTKDKEGVLYWAQSTVGRKIIPEILQRAGLDVLVVDEWNVPTDENNPKDGRFLTLDTEDVKEEFLEMARDLMIKHKRKILVTTDGDADRPAVFLLLDETDDAGKQKVVYIPGDKLNVLMALLLKPKFFAVPITANHIAFQRLSDDTGATLEFTKVGSPYIAKAMHLYLKGGGDRALGCEVNGGAFTGDEVFKLPPELLEKLRDWNRNSKNPLPEPTGELLELATRTSTEPVFGLFLLAKLEGKTVVELVAEKFSGKYASETWAGLVENVSDEQRTIGCEDYKKEMGPLIAKSFSPQDGKVVDVSIEGTTVQYIKSGDKTKKLNEADAQLTEEILGLKDRLEHYLKQITGLEKETIIRINFQDGIRVFFSNGEVIHFRASSNAAQFRVYALTKDKKRAKQMVDELTRDINGRVKKGNEMIPVKTGAGILVQIIREYIAGQEKPSGTTTPVTPGRNAIRTDVALPLETMSIDTQKVADGILNGSIDIGLDTEPLLMTGEIGYTWGEPYEKSLNETGILGLMKNYLKDKFAPLMQKLGITEKSIIAERLIGAGLLNNILSQSVLQLYGVKFFGKRHLDEFGNKMLTAKHLTSSKQLSIQSHDFDEMIIAQDKGSAFIGLKKDVAKEEMLKALLTGEIENVMNRVVLEKGDIYIIPAGTIHAYGVVNVFEVKAVTAEEDRTGTRSFYDRAKLAPKLKVELEKVVSQKLSENLPPLEEIQKQVMEWLNSEEGGLKYGYTEGLVRPKKDVLTMEKNKLEANIAAASLKALNPDTLKLIPLTIPNQRGEEARGEKLELLSYTNSGFAVERFTLKGGSGAWPGLMSDQLASKSPHTLFVNSGKVELTYANGVKEVLEAGAEKLMPANIGQYRLGALGEAGEEAVAYVQYKPLREERIVTTVFQATQNELKRLGEKAGVEQKKFKIWAPQPLYRGQLKAEQEFMAQISGGNVTIKTFNTMEDLTGFDPERDVLVATAGQLKGLSDNDPLKARLTNARIVPLQQDYFDMISTGNQIRGYAREINEFGFILGDTTDKEIADPTSSRAQDILKIARVMTGNQKIDAAAIKAFLTAEGNPNDRFKKLTETLPLAMPIDHETDRALEENRREVLKSV